MIVLRIVKEISSLLATLRTCRIVKIRGSGCWETESSCVVHNDSYIGEGPQWILVLERLSTARKPGQQGKIERSKRPCLRSFLPCSHLALCVSIVVECEAGVSRNI